MDCHLKAPLIEMKTLEDRTQCHHMSGSALFRPISSRALRVKKTRPGPHCTLPLESEDDLSAHVSSPSGNVKYFHVYIPQHSISPSPQVNTVILHRLDKYSTVCPLFGTKSAILKGQCHEIVWPFFCMNQTHLHSYSVGLTG